MVMILFVDQSGLKDLQEVFADESVTFQESQTGSVREVGTGSWPVIEVQANLPEVRVPPEYREGEGGTRAFRLPSGKLILTDLEGNLEQITRPTPGRA
jgi:hypothetical protein